MHNALSTASVQCTMSIVSCTLYTCHYTQYSVNWTILDSLKLYSLAAHNAITVDVKSGLLSSRAGALRHLGEELASFSMDGLFTSGQDAPSHEPELSLRFGESTLI